jgi:tRNA(Ile)-lysidine synthase
LDVNCSARAAVADSTATALTGAEAAALFAPLLAGSSGVIVAVSGGPDSMALLALLAEWGEVRLCAATVDHGLRLESAVEADDVRAYCQIQGIPHETLRWLGDKPASGLQAAARAARYALLTEHARKLGLSHLATAHHADDQAETVLMRLAAGSGIAGLAAMRPQSKRQGILHIRPFLQIAKARLIKTCKARGIPFADDLSNRDARFARARLRHGMDVLTAEGLTVERLGRLASRAARADDALEAVTASFMASLKEPDWNRIAAQPEEIRLRVLGSLLKSAGPSEALKLERLENLLQAIDKAHADGARLRRSLGDRIVTLLRNGQLSITAAPPRQRGGRPAPSRHET